MLTEQRDRSNEENIKEILLAICLDGKIHAIDMKNGQLLWTNDEILEKATFSTIQDIRPDRIFYVIEPFQEGNIYACIEGHSIQKLPISIKKIVDSGPISWSDGTIFLGYKRSDIFKIDSISGRITDDIRNSIIIGINDYSLQASKDFYESSYCDFAYREITEIFDLKKRQSFDPTLNSKIDNFGKPFIHVSIDGYLFFKKEWADPHLKWVQKFEFPITGLLIAKKADFDYYQTELVYPQEYKNKKNHLHFGFIKGQVYVLPNAVYPFFSKMMKSKDQSHHLKFYEIIKKYKNFNIHSAISTEPLHYIYASKPIGLLGSSKHANDQYHSWTLLFIISLLIGYYTIIVFKKIKNYGSIIERMTESDISIKTQINFFDVSFEKAPKFLKVSDVILGYGSHGTIVFDGSFDKRRVAIKRFLSDFYNIAEQEVNLLQHSDHHPNIIRYYYKEQTEKFIFIALEFCPYSLVDIIERKIIELSPARKREIITEILNGIHFLHSKNILHRDLKPANIMVSSENRILISDFGLSRKIVGQFEFTEHSSGTLGWRAPEIIISELANDNIILTKSADMFSFGCMCYYIITDGKHPFGDKNNREINIMQNNIYLDPLKGDPLSEDLIIRLLEHDYKKRPSSENIKLHPFFWTDTMKLKFLMDFSDFLETQSRHQNILSKRLEQIRHKVFHSKKSWKEQLDPSFITDLEKFRKYNYFSLQDLLRAIRNKRHHLDAKNEKLLSLIGIGDTSFLKYLNQQFPTMILEIFKLMEFNTKELHSEFIQLYHLDKLKLYI